MNVGDVVQMKSGTGPKMTITSVDGKRSYCTFWCPQAEAFKEHVFQHDALKPASPTS